MNPIPEKIVVTHSEKILRLSLNRPAALNALDKEMIASLHSALLDAAHSKDVAILIIDSLAPKGFCAGGDVRHLGEVLLSKRHNRESIVTASDYFAAEFALDFLIHNFPKPILAIANGITMGGGIGLFAGASHRLALPDCLFAMPEVSIGYFPDVGATWFLREFPEEFGLYLGITGARFSTGDAFVFGLANFSLEANEIPRLISRLEATAWTDSVDENHQLLSTAIGPGLRPSSPLWESRHLFKELFAANDLPSFLKSLEAMSDSEIPGIALAKVNCKNGSPNSLRVIFSQLKQTPRLNKRESFLQEWQVATNLAAYPDFAEGVRALLIDKDKCPAWVKAEIDPKLFFQMPAGFSNNPLSDLL